MAIAAYDFFTNPNGAAPNPTMNSASASCVSASPSRSSPIARVFSLACAACA